MAAHKIKDQKAMGFGTKLMIKEVFDKRKPTKQSNPSVNQNSDNKIV